MRDNILRVGVGGPVGSGKTSLIEALCKQMRDRYHIAVVTNDIYTKEDAQILIRAQALAEDRIVGVETGGCPHTAIREDASMNLAAIDAMVAQVPDARLHLRRKRRRQPRRDIQPRARRPHDLRHRRRGRRENSAQGRPRHHALGSARSSTRSTWRRMVGASLDVMERDTLKMRGERPLVFTNIKERRGLDVVEQFIVRAGMLEAA